MLGISRPREGVMCENAVDDLYYIYEKSMHMLRLLCSKSVTIESHSVSGDI